MRPCSNCGSPIANNLTTCSDCVDQPPTLMNVVRDQDASKHSSEDDDRRGGVYKFLSWAFVILVVLLPALGYLLGGLVIAIVFGVMGLIVFGLLEQLSH